MKTYQSSDYLPRLNLSSYCKLMADKFPWFYETLWFDRPGIFSLINKINSWQTDFEGKAKGGRGDSYRQAQTDPSVRITGIRQILQLAAQNQDFNNLPDNYKILDVLGGDGILARTYQLFKKGNHFKQPILTGDIAADMIVQALKYNLPAIRQPAQYLFLKNNSFDAVILAYGTHHILPQDRLMVCKEVFRVLKPNGKIVIHDFEKNSPVAQWFNKVVDKYSYTGHKCFHFTAEELRLYLQKSGFKDIKISYMYDPFIIFDAQERRAYERIMDYVLNMYGLEKLKMDHDCQATRKLVCQLINKHIFYNPSEMRRAKICGKESLSFYKENGHFIAEMPRVALVAVGTK